MIIEMHVGSVNDSRVAALLRAWRQRHGRMTKYIEKRIRDAIDRVDREETTMQMELDRIRGRRRGS